MPRQSANDMSIILAGQQDRIMPLTLREGRPMSVVLEIRDVWFLGQTDHPCILLLPHRSMRCGMATQID